MPGARGRWPSTPSVGIDVGADRLHCAVLDDESRVVETSIFRASEVSTLGDWLEDHGAMVAIDAPAQLSTCPHRDDPLLKPKFAVGRCAEIALAREYGIWVPWVAPAEAPSAGWIAVGLALFEELGARSVEAIEVYPHGAYRELVKPDRLPKKTTVAGVLARVEALRGAGIEEERLEMWSHDALDALVAALVARDHRLGTARRASCGHDESAIWLPAALPAA
jgi:predicted nuclease with RNAse H fold